VSWVLPDSPWYVAFGWRLFVLAGPQQQDQGQATPAQSNERFLDTRPARCTEMQDRGRDTMGRQIGSRRAHRVAAALPTQATDNPPDYIDTFEVPTDRTDTRTPEQWARAVFEGAPRKSRWFLLLPRIAQRGANL
jgi:hypothetical protein